MRHRVHGRKLGRTTAHRKALFRNQLTALFTHERIVTTLEKAKELRPLAERMVTLARTGSLPARRKILRVVPDKEIVGRLFDDIAPRFMDRPGGYTRILKLGRRRGDNAQMALIELVDFELEEREASSGGERKQSLMDRARSMFGGGAPAAEGAREAAGTDEPEAEPDDETPVEAASAEDALVEDASVEEPGSDDEADGDDSAGQDDERKG
jgi:large subunit ribosomal protein L17